ncbi:MAG: globin [Merismopedia sp. SIO2A8]|nr:globin [Merismopedia sp. SIO2A8]
MDEVDEATGLKIALLESSFEKVKPVANDFVASFYDNLFTDYPAAKPLFAHSDMKVQGGKLLKSLVFVVENLRKPGELTDALKGLGARHVKYGALPEHYPLVGSSLLKTFEQYLKDDWTQPTKQAWVDAYGLITEVMLEGADYSKQDVALDSVTPAASGKDPMDEVDEATGLKVALLESSFEKVKPVANDFVASFYDNLFTDYPAAKPLFAHSDMKTQGGKLLKSLVFVVENLRKPGELTRALKGLGARHVKYGALPEHYPLVGSSLLKTFEQYLKDDWTAPTKQAWIDAYGLITEVMLEGADYSKDAVKIDSVTPSASSSEAPVLVPGPNATSFVGGLAGVLGILTILFLILL